MVGCHVHSLTQNAKFKDLLCQAVPTPHPELGLPHYPHAMPRSGTWDTAVARSRSRLSCITAKLRDVQMLILAYHTPLIKR